MLLIQGHFCFNPLVERIVMAKKYPDFKKARAGVQKVSNGVT